LAQDLPAAGRACTKAPLILGFFRRERRVFRLVVVERGRQPAACMPDADSIRLCVTVAAVVRIARARSRCDLLEVVLWKEHQEGRSFLLGRPACESATGNMVVSQKGACSSSVAATVARGGAGCSLADCLSQRQDEAHSSTPLLASDCAASEQWSCGRTWDSLCEMAARGVG
jgi:hypothetical protein